MIPMSELRKISDGNDTGLSVDEDLVIDLLLEGNELSTIFSPSVAALLNKWVQEGLENPLSAAMLWLNGDRGGVYEICDPQFSSDEVWCLCTCNGRRFPKQTLSLYSSVDPFDEKKKSAYREIVRVSTQMPEVTSESIHFYHGTTVGNCHQILSSGIDFSHCRFTDFARGDCFYVAFSYEDALEHVRKRANSPSPHSAQLYRNGAAIIQFTLVPDDFDNKKKNI